MVVRLDMQVTAALVVTVIAVILWLLIKLVIGVGLNRVGCAVKKRRELPSTHGADTQTDPMEGVIRRMDSVNYICWLEPSSERNCWRVGPRCNGFHNRESRVVRHRACLVCTYGMAKTPSWD